MALGSVEWVSWDYCSDECVKVADACRRLQSPDSDYGLVINGLNAVEGVDYEMVDAKQGLVTLLPGALKDGGNSIAIAYKEPEGQAFIVPLNDVQADDPQEQREIRVTLRDTEGNVISGEKT